MSEALSDFIARRKADLVTRRDELQAELGPVLAELAEIEWVERAKSRPAQARQGQRRLAHPTDPTMKGRILTALAQADRLLTANEIRDRIETQTGAPIDRTTFSPQLSRLCQAGQVIRTGMTYGTSSLPAETEEPPHGRP